RFLARLGEGNVSVRPAHAARQVTPLPDGRHLVEFAHGRRETFDRVVLTVPAPLAAQVCPALTARERERLQGVAYQGLICASMLRKRPLSPYYVTNITEGWVPFTAVIEMTALIDRQQFGGNALVFLPKYVASGDPAFAWGDAEVEGRFLDGL